MMNDLDKVVEVFDAVTKGRFLDNLIPWRYEPDEINIPFWLQSHSLNTIAEWIVAFYESRIVKW